MSKMLGIACAVALMSLLISGMALAGVPCAGTTTVVATGNGDCTPGAAVCPGGDMDTVTVTVTVRDCYGTPLSGETVEISPGSAGFCFCDSIKTAGPTDATGTASATYIRFGGCGQLQFYATIGTVVAGPSPAITIASVDANGDCNVDLVDFGIFSTSYRTDSSCSDYNCAGDPGVDLIDFGIFAVHYRHSCTNP